MFPNTKVTLRRQIIAVRAGICPAQWKPGVLTEIRMKTLLDNRGRSPIW